MAIAGLRGTGDWATDERPKNFREMILWRNPNGQAPLTALLSKMKSESTDDPEFNWYEEQLDALRLTINYTTGYTTTATSLVITSNLSTSNAGTDVVAGDLFLVEQTLTSAYADELIMASAAGSANTITVTRGIASTTPVALANGAKLTKIGNAYEEGSTAPTSTTRNPSKLYNYCQIFKTTYDITNTAKKTKTRTGDPIKNDKKRKMFDHSVAMEMAFIFGKRVETTGANGKPLRLTGGLLWHLSQNASSQITVYATTPTETTFTDAIYKMFDYNSGAGNERIGFVGNGFLNSLNRLASSQSRTRVNFDKVVDMYGMRLQRWVMPQGEVYLKSHPLFNTHSKFTNDGLFIDPTAVRYRHLRDTSFKDNIQANDADAEKGQWLTEAGLEVDHSKTMAWLSNFVV